MGEPGHEFDKAAQRCSCGWEPFLNCTTHREQQWAGHLANVRTMTHEAVREEALYKLRRLANARGNETNPTEDVIDLAQAVLALLGEEP